MMGEYDFVQDIDEIFLVKEIGAEDTSGIIVDAQYSNYALFVGIPMKRRDIRKCPRCSKYFAELPAISRKDNKTEICSACGMEETLEAFGIDPETLDFLKNAQKFSDKYNTKITIEMPNQKDIVLEPEK